MRILLVEDDPMIGDGLASGLRHAGFAVDWLTDGSAAEHAVDSENFDAMILDLGLPKQDGMSVLRNLRAKKHALPVLILTARDAKEDKLSGLDAGADDYLLKPFDLDELLARLRAVMRRAAGTAETVLEHGALRLAPDRHEVTLNGVPIELSSREFALLHTLMRNVGRVMSRSQLEQSLYSWDDAPGSNTVEVHIHHLRKKLGNDPIRTLRGVGYMLSPAP
jgi:DNA-binding response OmpR family regulator